MHSILPLAILPLFPCLIVAEETARFLDRRLHHLRIVGPREWTEFPERADATGLELKFVAARNVDESTLQLRQEDVKQTWDVSLNGKPLGKLVRDENEMVVCFSIPANTLLDGENVLTIQQDSRRKTPDDIRLGDIQLHNCSRKDLLNESTLELEVADGESKLPLPARITIVRSDGALQATGALSNDHLAVRPGIVYTSSGKARIGLPAGRYKIHAGRGFEYSLDSTEVELAAGQHLTRTLTIRREVPTAGYVACDTHTHTLTHSGHGDATVEERMITLAAEGIELPIATDHNVHIDHNPFARKMDVRRYFTPVMGNEVTTRIGHFNIFPVSQGARLPDHGLTDWRSILDDIYRTPGVKVAILNHARDLHSGVRPFGPELFNSAVGENVAQWSMRFNAMEVINSGATQSDPLRLFHDWMALLNRGHRITPVGSSDSHDVARHFVGQGRTYIRCDDTDPGNIDVEQAVNNFLQGRVMVSYGLLVDVKVEDKFGPGELATVANDEVRIAVRVLGPHWVDASRVTLYANGQKIREVEITDPPRDLPRGIKWRGEWTLPRPDHDVHLVAIATGPGVNGLYWRTAKAYQPTSPDWQAKVIGCSGAVWLDADGDGRKTAAYDYARRLFFESHGDLETLLTSLAGYDRAVAAQAASLYQSSGKSLLSEHASKALNSASEATQVGFHAYLNAWRECQLAQQQN